MHVLTISTCRSLSPYPPEKAGVRSAASTRFGHGAFQSRVRNPPSGIQPSGFVLRAACSTAWAPSSTSTLAGESSARSKPLTLRLRGPSFTG